VSKRPAKPPQPLEIGEDTDRFSIIHDSEESAAGEPQDDFDLLEDFDPDSDASCWDPGEIDLEEPEFDPRDFCLDDDDD
jgi:hypothetical protein